MSGITNLRMVDARVRMAMPSTFRGVVASSVVSGRVSVHVAGGVLTALVPVLPVTLAVGDVVELSRPRGPGGQLHVREVLV